jgi:hypothetical protein
LATNAAGGRSGAQLSNRNLASSNARNMDDSLRLESNSGQSASLLSKRGVPALRKPAGKQLKLNRSAVSEGVDILDAASMETLLTICIVNYSAYMAYMYITGGHLETIFPHNVCPILRDLGWPTAAVKAFATLGVTTLPAPGRIVAMVYILIGNVVLITTLRLRYARFAAANSDKAVAQATLSEQNALIDSLRLQSAYAPEVATVPASSADSGVSFGVPFVSNNSRARSASSGNGMAQSAASAILNMDEPTDEPNATASISASGKPFPGNTLLQVTTPQRNSPPHSWSKIDPTEFNVRIGPNYSWNKKKAPSAAALYECFAVDVFSAAARIDNVGQRFEIPDMYTKVNTRNAFVPPVFVVQIQIPADSPSLFSTVTDGPGWAMCMFFRITESTLTQLKDLNNASPAVRLWAKWCEHAEQDKDWRSRFKFIPSCSNLVELGVPSSIANWNAKPILIRKTGTLFRGNNSKYMEFDMHVHKFDNLAKKSIHYMTAMCSSMYMQIGFVIEGIKDDELPEVLFGACAINCPQESRSEFLFD